MSRRFPDTHTFLAGRQFNELPVYVVGGRTERRVTLYSQQCRALNLVAALDSLHGASLRDKSVAVIGAGAAGITAAGALRSLDVDRVSVFDRGGAPLHVQRASFSRFLHPNLFHWPESGWDEPNADLPLGAWEAGYADAVRRRILTTCGGDLQISYCTDVVDVTATPSGIGVRLRLRRLETRVIADYEFDLVLVAAGFPAEKPPRGALGGSYWHAVTGLADMDGAIHVIGDGDGALTEVIMLYIDRLGHRAVTGMAHMLQDDDVSWRADLEAQGTPKDNADPPRTMVAPSLLDLFRRHDRGTGDITIHANRAMKGGSFLLNRVLVGHILWMGNSRLTIDQANVSAAGLAALDGTVVWRAGLGPTASPLQPFEKPALSTKSSFDALSAAGTLSPSALGVLAHTVDALRRPLWSNEFDKQASSHSAQWSETAPAGIAPVAAQPSAAALAALPYISATIRDLDRLGVALRVDAVDHSRRFASIETLVRVLSVPHAECLVPAEASAPVEPTNTSIWRDDIGRLWFELGGLGDRSTRPAVAALVDPTRLPEWAKHARRNRPRFPGTWKEKKTAVHTETLRGITDLSTMHPPVLDVTWRAHFDRGEGEDAMRAVLRLAWVPSGRDERMAKVGDRTRHAMLDAARIIERLGTPRSFEPEDRWSLLAAAAADLAIPAGTQTRVLSASATLITGAWASRVRAIGRSSFETPPFFTSLQLAAEALESSRPSGPPTHMVSQLANEALLQAPPRASYVIARFGVQPATGEDRAGDEEA